MAGAWITVYSGMLATLIGVFLGTLLGVYSAIGKSAITEVVMRFGDLLLAFPALLIATLVSVRYGSSTITAVLAIGIAFVPYVMRFTRVSVIKVYKSDYVLTAKTYGLGKVMILKKHVLPNVFPQLSIQAMLLFSVAVLSESGLSYLGLGTPPPSPAWGDMLSEAQSVILTDPLLVLWPTLAIALTVLGFNLLAEGILAKADVRNM
jgi:peptide/nickel transport system permease protein